jgi:hypothetical protein
MSVVLTIAGQTFDYPSTADDDWGDQATNWAVAVSTDLLQRTGGNFTLTNDVNFGASFATIQAYLKSRTANIANAGFIRMARADVIAFRNNANSGNNLLGCNTSDEPTWNGVPLLLTPGGVLAVADGGTGLSSYTAGDLLYASATTTLAKLGIGSANRVLVSNGSIPGYALLVNANIDAAAAIAFSKMAALTASKLIESSSGGVIQVSTGTGFVKASSGTPSYSSTVNAATEISGILPKANGGSGQDNSSISFPAAGTLSTQLVNWAQNPGFDLWQRQTSATTANAGRLYVCDRWYTNNILGTNGVITTSRQTGNVSGSKYALRQVISTAPTAGQTNGCELYQVLENQDSLNFYGQNASFSIYVRAQGNVNQVGIQFYYANSEVALTTSIGSEVTASVSSGADTLIAINGQSLAAWTNTSGVIGVRVRITGVSSGNTYDLNNGFQVEQAMLNLGSAVGSFNKPNLQAITATCLRFYEKTYAPGTFAGSTTLIGCEALVRGNGSNTLNVRYQVPKRSVGSPVAYSTQTGASGFVYDPGGAADRSANLNNGTVNGFIADPGSATVGNVYLFQWTADSEI